MKISLRKMGVFLLAGLLGCTEASPPSVQNNEVEILGLPSFLEVVHGTEVELNFQIQALDGLSSSKIFQDRIEKEVMTFRGEKESPGRYSLKAQITDDGFWEPSLKDSIEVVIYARDVDGDSHSKRVVIKILAP
ncbi:hypothetical protein DFQ04_2792 [Algoriphagus boseongensis]|uniref:YtkA-like protein n=1 Tax=Algoriphagus boseongensis TaxID=1442587 RepID=A0A4R6T7M1_9BACT|nr:hypothetical protein [Algoriphagus boseongensis]TDQ16670.1 hypothetical protein DFQ04_2792 [Algoriphagus boseongensis]